MFRPFLIIIIIIIIIYIFIIIYLFYLFIYHDECVRACALLAYIRIYIPILLLLLLPIYYDSFRVVYSCSVYSAVVDRARPSIIVYNYYNILLLYSIILFLCNDLFDFAQLIIKHVSKNRIVYVDAIIILLL